MSKRVIEHDIKLEKSVKIILAALAFGVLAHAFVPAFSTDSAFAAVKKTLGSGTISVRVNGPVRLSGDLGLGGKLALGGAVKCNGCTP
ncbi:MAG: hypothetical protein HN377_05125 [Alphaproteobacteria bacterium]|jgi:hypothetical protein|nr:hypothetical protein [Alphaproteobacteria bacterium]MBT7942166.1 hypothetical protein [Alphaproteobacteria bacterium]